MLERGQLWALVIEECFFVLTFAVRLEIEGPFHSKMRASSDDAYLERRQGAKWHARERQ